MRALFLARMIKKYSSVARFFLLATLLVALMPANAQTLHSKLSSAFKTYTGDGQHTYGITGFVVEEVGGKAVYSSNGNVGLAPASAQKVVTAAAMLDVFGPDYRYSTAVKYSGSINASTLNGDLLLAGSGDPSLGSWRYKSQPEDDFFQKVADALKARGIKQITGNIVGTNTSWTVQAIPGGWIYDDMGNYYGAGTWALNYHENQYDVHYNASGTPGSRLQHGRQEPAAGLDDWDDFIELGNAGTGDNGYIYAPPYSTYAFTNGTLGKTNKNFPISGSMPHGEWSLLNALKEYLAGQGIAVEGEAIPSLEIKAKRKVLPAASGQITNYESPTLDSLVYWFLQKSINLYGEAMLKTLAAEKKGTGSTDEGREWMQEFWAGKGIPRQALRVQDGSGLSPQNRLTAQSLVQVMQYARRQSWYPEFYDGLPTINGKKMKSGTIGGAKSYTGYLKDAAGKEYCFAIITNNYSGSASALVQKMWRLLDVVVKHR